MIGWYLTYAALPNWAPLAGIKGIKRAPAGAEYLMITRDDKPITAIPLSGMKPIFCEARAVESGPNARPGGAFHMAYVFGRALPGGTSVDLWTIDESTGEIVACSEELYELAKGGVLNCIGALDG